MFNTPKQCDTHHGEIIRQNVDIILLFITKKFAKQHSKMTSSGSNLSAQYVISIQLDLYIVLTLLKTSEDHNDFNKFKQTNLARISYVPTRFIK